MRHIVFVLPPPSGALIVKRFRNPVPSHPTDIWGNIWEKPARNWGKSMRNSKEILGTSWELSAKSARNHGEKMCLGN